MSEKITCRLCNTEFEDNILNCPGCKTETVILKRKVQLPIPKGVINDYASVLSTDQLSDLTGTLDKFFTETHVPIVVSIVHDTSPLTPGEYAFLMYNEWGIGRKGVNRGLLLLLALKERHLESEVGLGLEKVISENEGDEIVQNEFLPHFREGGFYEGLKAGTEAIIKVLEERLPPV